MIRKLAIVGLALAAFACGAEDAKLDIQIKDVKKQATLVMKTNATRADISKELAKIYPKVSAYLNAKKIKPSAPFALYRTTDGENFEIEAGFLVPQGTQGEGEIVSGELPGGKVAHTVHTGSYDALPRTYGAIMHWLEGKKLNAAGPAWEVYITDPGTTKPEELKTEVYMPVEKKK